MNTKKTFWSLLALLMALVLTLAACGGGQEAAAPAEADRQQLPEDMTFLRGRVARQAPENVPPEQTRAQLRRAAAEWERSDRDPVYLWPEERLMAMEGAED